MPLGKGMADHVGHKMEVRCTVDFGDYQSVDVGCFELDGTLRVRLDHKWESGYIQLLSNRQAHSHCLLN